MKKRYCNSLIMKRAWVLFRKGEYSTFGEALKYSWYIAKNVPLPTFEDTYKKYFQKVVERYKYKSYTENQHMLVEDIAQDAFMKVFSNLHLYDPKKSAFVSWLYNVVNNTFIDFSRLIAEKNRQNNVEVSEAINVTSNIKVSDKNLLGQITKVIDKTIKPKDKEIFMLFNEGFLLREIAEKLDMNINSIKISIYRTRQTLQPLMKQYV